MRIISKLHKLNRHTLQAKLKTASHRFALMVDNYSPDDTEAENGLLMVTGKVFVPGYTDATVTIVYPKRKRSTDQSFYYITPTESTEDMSLAYSDDTFYPRFSECEQAVKDLPEVTVSQYFYDKGIIPDDPSTFTALTGIPLESSLVNDINEITGEDTNYYTIGADPEHKNIDKLIKDYTNYQDGDKIIPYLDITDKFFNNGTPTRFLESNGNIDFIGDQILVSPTDFYNSLTIILRQPSEHPELNTHRISNYDDWCITVTSTFISEIENYGFDYSQRFWMSDFNDRVSDLVYSSVSHYWHSLYSSLDEWASLVNNGILQIGSQNLLLPDLYNEYHNVCGDGNPWTYKNLEFTIKTKDLEGFTPVEGLGNGVFHFVLHSDNIIEESLSHFSNPTFLNENPNDNQLYLTDLPNDRDYDTRPNNAYHLYSTVYFASNKRGREIVFLHLPDSLMSGCLDTAPSWTTLNYLKTQGQQLMNCLQETILSLSQDDNEEPAVVDENTIDGTPSENTDSPQDLMNRLTDKGWTQQTPTTIISPTIGDAKGNEYFKLQFTCIDNTWRLSSIIVPCEATGGEVPLPLSDTQLNEDVTSEDIQYDLEKIAESGNLWADSFVKANSKEGWLDRYNTLCDYDRWTAIVAANFINSDLRDLSNVTPNLEKNPVSIETLLTEGNLDNFSNAIEWVERVLQAFNLPHSLNIPSDYKLSFGIISTENGYYRIKFNTDSQDYMLEVELLPAGKSLFPDVYYETYWPLWTDLFDKTSYADFTTILPGVGPYLTILYLFNQPILEDPQILNNIQRIINNEFQLERDQQAAEEAQQKADQWLSQVTECMNQSQIFTQTDDNEWKRSTAPIVINGVDYSQQIVGEIIIHADPNREEIRIKPKLHPTLEADSIFQYYGSLVPEKLANALDKNRSLWGSTEKVNTLVGHDVINGIMTSEQLTAVEENTHDILPWLSNSSAQQVKALQNAAGWVQYCDKILNNEDIPSLDFIKQGLHGNIFNLLRKNNVSGTTGINDFLQSLGAIPLKSTNDYGHMEEAGSNFYPFAYDVCRYYALPVEVNGWGTFYCALAFTKQNGKPVCQLQDNYLCVDRGANSRWKYRFAHVIDEDPGTHFTTLGDTFNSLVTGAGLPNYNLLRFLQEQLANGLQATDAVPQALEENKEYIDNLLNMR